MKNFFIALISFFGLSCFAQGAFAQNKSEWVVAGTGSDLLSYIDSKSVIGEDDHLVGWLVRYNNDPSYLIKGRIVGHEVIRYAWDCHSRKGAIIYSISYDRGSRVLESGSEVPSYAYNWRYAAPDTVGEAELEKACYYAPDKKYFADLPEIIRKRREMGLDDYYVAESMEELIEYSKDRMPWTNAQAGAPRKLAPPAQPPKRRKK